VKIFAYQQKLNFALSN